MTRIIFDADDLQRTLKHFGVTMDVQVGEVIFSDGKARWSADYDVVEEDDHK